MRAAFFGTPPAAVPTLAALASIAEVSLVVTPPDRPRGRSKTPVAPAVKEAAADFGFPIVQPDRAREVLPRLEGLGVDVAVVVAFGQLLPPALLAATRRGFVNVHFSLLPRWRGAAPVQRAIAAGDDVTGSSLMVLDEGLDTGPVLASVETDIGADEHAGRLSARLADLGAALLRDHLGAYVAGDLAPVPQDDAAATSAPKVTVEEAHVSARMDAAELGRRVRAFHPRPGAWAEVDGTRMGILRASAAPGDGPEQGAIELIAGRVLLGCDDGPVELAVVQPAGKEPMAATAWMNGRRGEPAALG